MNTTTTELIDRELRRQRGVSLAQWAAERALTPLMVVWMIEGTDACDGSEAVLFDLREAIGGLPGVPRQAA